MNWIELTEKPPKQRQDCIVLTESGGVYRVIAHNKWLGGFCMGDGKTGIAIDNVTHWVPFVRPNAEVSERSAAGAESARLPG